MTCFNPCPTISPTKSKTHARNLKLCSLTAFGAAKIVVVETARGLVCSRLEKRHDLLSVAESQPFRKLCLLISCRSFDLFDLSKDCYALLLSLSSVRHHPNFTMRLAPILLLLPALAVAEDQKPFIDIAKGWFEQVKSYIPTAVPSISPLDAGASVVAANKVEKININNYKRKLGPSPDGPTEWLIMVSGKNESCFGGCDSVNLKWNVSALLHAQACDSVTCDGPRLMTC
jgi:hypothetical protein